MSHSDSIRRVVEILNRLNDGKNVTVERLSQLYEVHPRTIRRDLALIKEIFGAFLIKEGDSYRAYEKPLLDRVLSATQLMQLSNIVNLLQLTDHDQSITESTRALIKRANEVYAFKSKPFEQLQNLDILKKLEHTITYRQSIHVLYQGNIEELEYLIKPYKIVFLNENFYLIGAYSHRNGESVQFLRLSMIRKVTTTGKTFKSSPKVAVNSL